MKLKYEVKHEALTINAIREFEEDISNIIDSIQKDIAFYSETFFLQFKNIVEHLLRFNPKERMSFKEILDKLNGQQIKINLS